MVCEAAQRLADGGTPVAQPFRRYGGWDVVGTVGARERRRCSSGCAISGRGACRRCRTGSAFELARNPVRGFSRAQMY